MDLEAKNQTPTVLRSNERRGFISKALKGISSLCLLKSAQAWDLSFLNPQSFFNPQPKSVYLEKSWISETRGKVVSYANYLSAHSYKVVDLHELLKTHFKKRRVCNCIPPKRLWKNIVPTLEVVDLVARELNCKEVKFISAYRSPRYNRSIGGAKKSFHMENVAVDVNFGCSSWKAMKAISKLRRQGKFVGGLGVYRNFIHIDTRPMNIDWGLYKKHRS